MAKQFKKKIFICENSMLAGCALGAIILCVAQISGNRLFIAACLLLFLAFHFFACQKGEDIYTLFFFLPWSPLLRLYNGSISFFTLALLLTCLISFQKNEFKFEVYQIVLPAFLAIISLIAKGIQSNSLEKSYLFFLIMLLLFPCVARDIRDTTDFRKLILFFSFGIIMAAISAGQVAAYPNISQYIRVDSYLTITRLSGYYRDPNFYSAHITAALAGVQTVMFIEKKQSRQLAWVILLMVLLYCGMLSASKSFAVVLICQLLIGMTIVLKKENKKSILIVITAALCLGAIVLCSSNVQNLLRIMAVRFSYASSLSELTTGRTDVWIKYYEELTRNPLLLLFGEGYTNVTIGGKASHNTIIQGIYQFGLIGFPILCTWVMLVIKRILCGGSSRYRVRYTMLLCVGVMLPWMAIDILFFDEFLLFPIYIAVGKTYVSREHTILAGDV